MTSQISQRCVKNFTIRNHTKKSSVPNSNGSGNGNPALNVSSKQYLLIKKGMIVTIRRQKNFMFSGARMIPFAQIEKFLVTQRGSNNPPVSINVVDKQSQGNKVCFKVIKTRT